MQNKQQRQVSRRRRRRSVKSGAQEFNNSNNICNEIEMKQKLEKVGKVSCRRGVQRKLNHVYKEFQSNISGKDSQQEQMIKEENAESQQVGKQGLPHNEDLQINMMQQEKQQISNALIWLEDSQDIKIGNLLNDILQLPNQNLNQNQDQEQGQNSVSQIFMSKKQQKINSEVMDNENQYEQCLQSQQCEQSQYQVDQSQIKEDSQDNSQQSKPSKVINTELTHQLKQLGGLNVQDRTFREQAQMKQEQVMPKQQKEIINDLQDRQKLRRQEQERLEIQKLKQKWPEFNLIFRSYSHSSIFNNSLTCNVQNSQVHMNTQKQQKSQDVIKKNNSVKNKKNLQKAKNAVVSKKKTSNKIKYFIRQFINRFYQNKDKAISDIFKPDHLPESKNMGEAELKQFQRELANIYNQVRMVMRQQISKYQENKKHNYSLETVRKIFGTKCNNRCRVKQDKNTNKNKSNSRQNLFRTPTENPQPRRCRQCLKSFLLRKAAHQLLFDQIIPSIFCNKQIKKQREEYVYTFLIQAYRCKNPILMGRSTVI